MPEGHTIHRLALDQQRAFGRREVRASTLQERFAAGAARIDGHVLRATEAYGKHLFHHYVGGPLLHVHLGLYGKFTTGTGAPPDPRGALRLRLTGGGDAPMWTDLRGPIACELIEPAQKDALLAKLGPDPLRRDARPDAAWARLARSRVVIAGLLMDQTVLAGVGNVYRAEVLFRHRLDPFRPGREVAKPLWTAIWADLVTLMHAGVKANRIVTVRPEDRPAGRGGRPKARLTRAESVYVYRHAGEPCRICGTVIRTEVLAGRNLFWCPHCQAPDAT